MNLSFSQRWALLSLAILITGAGWIWASLATPGSTTAGRVPLPREGFLAPDFRLETTSGETVELADLRGHPVLINLWATWCPPCRAEMPAIQRVHQEYSGQGLQVLAVNATNQDDASRIEAFARDYQLTFPILLDRDGRVTRDYQMRALPTTFFIDREGVIQEVVVGGPISEALLRIRVEKLLFAQERP